MLNTSKFDPLCNEIIVQDLLSFSVNPEDELSFLNQTRKNRKPELELAKIYPNAMMHQVRYPTPCPGANNYL